MAVIARHLAAGIPPHLEAVAVDEVHLILLVNDDVVEREVVDDEAEAVQLDQQEGEVVKDHVQFVVDEPAARSPFPPAVVHQLPERDALRFTHGITDDRAVRSREQRNRKQGGHVFSDLPICRHAA